MTGQINLHAVRSSRVLNYVGWTGHDNMGDQALYGVIQKIFNAYKLVPTTNSLVVKKPQLYSGITVFGGGTLLPRWAAFTMPNRFNYAYGVGVVDPDFAQYQYGARSQVFYNFAVQKTKKFSFRLVGVRGLQSKKLLDNWGVKSEVIGDPSLLLKPSSNLKRTENLVAVNVGSSEPYEPVWGKTEDVAKEVAKLCSTLGKEGYSIVLVPFSDVDMIHIQRISQETGLPIFEQYREEQSVVDFLSKCHVLIGQRLHSTAFSAAAFTPFLSIAYHSKCCEFSESVGFQDYTIRASDASAENLSQAFRRLNQNWDSMYYRLKEKVQSYRERLSAFGARVAEDIESLPEIKWSSPGLWKRTEFQILSNLELRTPKISSLWNRI